MRYILLFCLLGFSVYNTNAQHSIGFSNGLPELYNIAYELELPSNYSVELGNSFLAFNIRGFDEEWIGGGNPKHFMNHYFLNVKLKKYMSTEIRNSGFYFGIYLRYFRSHSHTDKWDNLSLYEQESISSFDEYKWAIESVTRHKFTIGGLAGYRISLGERLSFDMSSGLGEP